MALVRGPGKGIRLDFDALGQQVSEDLGSAPLRGPTEKRASRHSDTRQVDTSFVSASYLVDVATNDSHDEIGLFCTEHHISVPCPPFDQCLVASACHVDTRITGPTQPDSPVVLPIFPDMALRRGGNKSPAYPKTQGVPVERSNENRYRQ